MQRTQVALQVNNPNARLDTTSMWISSLNAQQRQIWKELEDERIISAGIVYLDSLDSYPQP